MAAQRKFDEETRQRALRMYNDRIVEHGDSKLAARKHVGGLLDIKPATLRNWVDNDTGPGALDVADMSERDGELLALRRENAELRRANDILKTATAFFAAAEVDRRLQ